ncbi:MAG TPA: hypothetical protein VLZ12_15260 [Verrucomicrobiae bacterium]|nr:hypothetical protein [Verrucomicrobiae bacterium]
MPIPVQHAGETLEGKIVFVDETQASICVANADGTENRVLPSYNQAPEHPIWFPSGDKIVYTTRWSEPKEIVMVDLAGTALKRIPCVDSLSNIVEITDVSLDGATALLTKSGAVTDDSGIYKLAIKDGTLTKILGENDAALALSEVRCKRVHVSHGTWSPDGEQISLTVSCSDIGCAIGIMRSDGSSLRLLTEFPQDKAKWRGFTNHGWSPDGGKILATNYRFSPRGLGYDPPYGEQVFVIDIASKRNRQVPSDSRYDRGDPCWSPNGAKILYSETRVARDLTYDRCLVVIDAGGNNPRRLFRGPWSWLYFLPLVQGQNDMEPRWWSPKPLE